MYEGCHGPFDYTIERRLAADGRHSWRWQVTRAGETIAAGVSPRSHDHAETAVLSFIFQIETDERCGRSAFAREARKVG